jgi:LPS export ABC transporter protein LptC
MWTLNASRADIIEGSDRIKLSDVVLWVENKDMTIYSPEGFYNMESRDLTLDGKIKAVSKGYTIITESVEWNQSKGEIKTKEAVKIESKKFNVEGVGMEADSEQKVRILKNVKATFFR